LTIDYEVLMIYRPSTRQDWKVTVTVWQGRMIWSNQVQGEGYGLVVDVGNPP
jgi:hypothetical protein